MEVVYKKFLKDEKYKVVTLEEIIRDFNNLNIDSIYLSTDSFLRVSDKKVVRIKCTDYDAPLVIEKSILGGTSYLLINADYYLNNQEIINKLIVFILENTKFETFDIKGSCFINNDIIDTICSNINIKEISIDRFNYDGYSLKYSDYLKFKKSHLRVVNTFNVDKELSDNFDPIIGCNFNKRLIGFYTYESISTDKYKSIRIYNNLTSEEIENLKYLSPNKIIEISDYSKENVKEICSRLIELKKNNKIVFNVENKNLFNDFIFSADLDYKNLFVSVYYGSEIPLKSYLRFEKLLYSIVEPAKNLSPFEQYIYVYNITKKYKEYKENDEEKMDARRLYSILENEYMVCVGFSALFGDLLEKLGIENIDLGISVDSSYDEVENRQIPNEEILTTKEGHARRYVHIIDEKYGIDGFYVSDPTWDNNLENDYYNHLALTDEEVTKARRYVWINIFSSKELFNIKSIEEFYYKINFLLTHNGDDLKEIVYDLIQNLKVLDKNYINLLSLKYNYITKYMSSYPDNIDDLIYDLGKYLTEHVNKEISGETIMSAVYNVYSETNLYGDSTEEEFKKMLKANKKRQEVAFPRRSKISAGGSVEDYDLDYHNKFDIAEIKKIT